MFYLEGKHSVPPITVPKLEPDLCGNTQPLFWTREMRVKTWLDLDMIKPVWFSFQFFCADSLFPDSDNLFILGYIDTLRYNMQIA